MAKQIFINLAVHNPTKSMTFYEALGFKINPKFSDDSGKCMVWSDNIFLMILSHQKFSSFTKKTIADTTTSIAALLSLSMDSIDEVNQVVESGLRAGGIEPNEMRNYGFMVQRTIEDFDGHTWEIFHMDMSNLPA
jgi:predicted lactoylglutathione lyase